MTKFSKIYLKNKKESHISIPLKYSFLRSLFLEHMSVKSVKISSFRQPKSGKFTTPPPKSSLVRPKSHNFTRSSSRRDTSPNPPNRPAGNKSWTMSESRRSPLLTNNQETIKKPRVTPTLKTFLVTEFPFAARSGGPFSKEKTEHGFDSSRLYSPKKIRALNSTNST